MQFNLETAVQGDKVMQDFELESLPIGGDHSQKVKAPLIGNDYGSKDCVNLSPSTAVSRFNGNIVFIGCGSVGQCTLAILQNFIDIPSNRITIIDFNDHRDKIAELIKRGARYVFDRLTPENYQNILKKHLSPGDLLIDLSWNIDTIALIEWCHINNICFLNTSVETWNPYKDAQKKAVTELTLYHRQMRLREMEGRWEKKDGPTAIVDHGANPGLVSHFTKCALREIAQAIIEKNSNDPRKSRLETALDLNNYPQLAHLTGVKTIHVSERDSQITNKPKRMNEFVNTWSVEGFIEEGIAPSEMGWGTHEVTIPKEAYFHLTGPKNQICLAQKGIKTWVKSWVPSGPITGMAIRHGEAFSISESLTLWDDNKLLYRPTVLYAYCPCDSAINSLHELEMSHFVPQKHQRILSEEIIEGKDELGCLLMGHDFGAWWIGSILDIATARRLVPGHNATIVQVAAGVVAAAVYALKHRNLGLCLPDRLDHEEILSLALPYLGEFLSQAVDWTPLEHARDFADYGAPLPSSLEMWQYATFALSPKNI